MVIDKLFVTIRETFQINVSWELSKVLALFLLLLKTHKEMKIIKKKNNNLRFPSLIKYLFCCFDKNHSYICLSN